MDHGHQGVIGGRLDRVGHLFVPVRVKTGHAAALGLVPGVLPQLDAGIDLDRVPHIIEHHVGVVYPTVDQHAALVLEMTPRGDDDAVARTSADVQVHIGRADRAAVDQGLGQAAHRVAPIILGHAEHLAAALLRRQDEITAAHRQGQRLFAQHVQSQVQRGAGHDVMRSGVGSHARGLQVWHFRHQLGDVLKHPRPTPQQLFRLVGQILGVIPAQVADRHQFDVVQTAVV